jgi:diketogulonate reductase-like aldo/keto reductase
MEDGVHRALPLSLDTRVRLNNGVEVPLLGLGVWQLPEGGVCRRSVLTALEAGVRLIDTAKVYENEREVGEAIRSSGVPRDEVFLTTKVWNGDQGYESTKRAFGASLKRLGVGHIDLYLVHWPVPEKRRDTWRAMEEILERGDCRAIGVSNYTEPHLDDVLEHGHVVPAVNQFELSPFLQPRDLVAKCRAQGIVVEGYSPLAKARRMDHPVVAAVAQDLGLTPAQVLIRWAIEKGFVTIPRSSSPERVRENCAVFGAQLGAKNTAALDALAEGYRTSWDPTRVT